MDDSKGASYDYFSWLQQVSMNQKYKIISIHLLACIAFLALPFLFAPHNFTREATILNPAVLRDLISFAFIIAFYYLNTNFLLPTYFFRREFAFYATVVVLYGVAVIVLPRILISFHPEHFDDLRHPPDFPNHRMGGPFGKHHDGVSLFEASHDIFFYLSTIFLSMSISINERWKQAQQGKLKAELDFLKAQVNPHFLFNSLNSIYSLAITKSDQTATAVLKLSGLMRYVITEATQEDVSLEKELNCLSDFVELQKIRLGDTVKVDYSIEGDPSEKRIAPFLILPFLENAFKYGVNSEDNSFILIKIKITELDINVLIFNNKVFHSKEYIQTPGLGIENTRTRLKLLYPGKHELTIQDDANDFSVTLNVRWH